MRTRKASLIFNPAAGQGDSEQDLNTIRDLLSPTFDLDIKFTKKDLRTDKIAQEVVKNGAEIVIAAGGDGTLSAVAKALIQTDIPLGVIPRGTANAFASALGLPDIIDKACQTIINGKLRRLDVAKCNNKPMLLLAGVGFEAETVEGASRETKSKWGALAYLLSGIKQLNDIDSFEVEIETEEKIIRTTATAITVANVAPATSVLAQGPAGIICDDGFLDITIVTSNSWTSAIAASYHLLQTGLRGDAVTRDDIGYLRVKQVKVTTEPPQKVVLDGELIGETPIEVVCVPKGLNVFVPLIPAEELTEKIEGLPGLEVEIKSD
ncbi:YegS/Rv2252/BmrU family lipid kinase [Mastigocoleus sp. MO_188.B34]|uniref:YegS/Rv2252/BmrU family lipid kinase n=1 Tax=Mastigocoleus sp. MO_188.B34 TaxID=3036635 RepID=UPI00260E00C7|nr:YegS/Rv2252/BmrU family lipid kinase [Mastigocoleus sp. MO_188.B34]MDJ0694193.1 YegS/Rv2252/BmrU family lipid kinase [Mastigocoleus sp. MO_188.B34]